MTNIAFNRGGDLESWQLILAIGGLLTPIVLAAMARDRSLMSMIATVQNGLEKHIDDATAPLHERVNRVRDEYVRRDDLDAHLNRMEKQFEDIRAEMRRGSDKVEARLGEMVKLLREGS